LKAQLYTKEVELNSLATERKKMLTKLQTTTLKLTDSESKISEQQSRYTTLEKRCKLVTEYGATVEKQLNKYGATVEKQLNKSQNILSKTKKAAAQKISKLETTVVALKNTLKNCRAQSKQKRAEAATANVQKNKYKQRLTNNMEKNRKRQEDIDNLTQHMATFIEKGRTEWSDMMPAGLNEKESRLWSILKCKSRSLNGAVQFSADTNARFATYHELFKDILTTRKNSKRKVVDLTVDTKLQLPINSRAKRQRTDAPPSDNELAAILLTFE
jgi:chromosome segregation ATPase